MRLPQRGLDQLLAVVAPAAGERDLAGVAAQAYVIGRGYQTRPTDGKWQISTGKPQDIAVYATFVQIRGS